MKTNVKIHYFVLLVASFLVGSCGKKGPIEPLEESKYPRTYPKPPIADQPSQKKPKQKEAPHNA